MSNTQATQTSTPLDNLPSLETVLDTVNKIVNAGSVSNTDTYLELFGVIDKHFNRRHMEWVAFSTIDEYRRAIHALLFCTAVTLVYKSGSNRGVTEHTGYAGDVCNTYAWWKIQEPGNAPLILDEKVHDTEVSLFETKQPLAAGDNNLYIRVRINELVNPRIEGIYKP